MVDWEGTTSQSAPRVPLPRNQPGGDRLLLDYVEAIMSYRSMEQIWHHHLAAMAAIGFNRVIYGFTRFRTANSLGDLQDMLVLSNHDPAYIRPFLEDGLYQYAPMTEWALDNVGATSWRETARRAQAGQLSEQAMRIIAFNREHGIGAGYSISFQTNSAREKGAIGLTAVPAIDFDQADAIWERHGRMVEAMSNVLHLRLTGMPNPATRRTLTARQREVLEWAGDGKTTGETADIMGLTPATIEKHLRGAREMLDVSTTAQAVLKAAFLNQTYTLSPPTISHRYGAASLRSR